MKSMLLAKRKEEMTVNSLIQCLEYKTMSPRILLFPLGPDGKTSLKSIWKVLETRRKSQPLSNHPVIPFGCSLVNLCVVFHFVVSMCLYTFCFSHSWGHKTTMLTKLTVPCLLIIKLLSKFLLQYYSKYVQKSSHLSPLYSLMNLYKISTPMQPAPYNALKDSSSYYPSPKGAVKHISNTWFYFACFGTLHK